MTIAEQPIQRSVHRFTREEYCQMAEMGFFANTRVELLAGEILDMAAQGEDHVNVVTELNYWLTRQLAKEAYQVRCQAPLAVDMASAPEPDFAIVMGDRKDKQLPPTTALLAIEVADSSLARDRGKIPFFAAAGVKEYWIINLRARVIEQYTRPQQNPQDPAEPARYAQVRTLGEFETIACTVLPLAPWPVKDLLPHI